MFDEIYLAGELRKRDGELSPEERRVEFHELKTRLRRLKNRRLRSHETHQLRVQPAPYAEAMGHLARVSDHSRSVLRETEALFEAGRMSAQVEPEPRR
jgi:hypothetical protein